MRNFLTIALGLFAATQLNAQTAFTPGNIVVSRIGSGAGPYSTTNTVYLDEYTPSGTFVRTLTMPTTSGAALLQSQNIEEGFICRSAEGQFLSLAGYSKSGASGVNGTTAVVTPRSLASVKYDGTVAVFTPTVTTPAAMATGTVNVTNPTTITGINVTSGTIAVGQYAYGTYMPYGVTVAAINGTTVTLSAGGNYNSGASTIQFMTAATPNFASGKSPCSAITSNGTDFWLCSRETSLQYYNSTTNTMINIASGSTGTAGRTFNIADGQLYASNDFGLKLAKIGTGLPTDVANTSGLQFATGSFAPTLPTGFYMLDVSSTEPGADVMYIAENGGTTQGIYKYSKVNGEWVRNGGYGTYTDVYKGITGVVENGLVTLYAIRKTATTSSGELVKISDAGGYAQNMNGSEAILAAYNTGQSLGGAWRGVAMAPNLNTLPLTLVSFTAAQNNNGNVLQWITTNETNVDGFHIEKSTDGASFTTLAQLNARNDGQRTTYSYTDKSITAVITYYRIKMQDKDGRFTYSKTIALKASRSNGSAISHVYPNPASTELYIDYTTGTDAAFLQVYDMSGVLLMRQAVPQGAGQAIISTGSLKPGTYTLQLSSGNSAAASQRFIKK